MKFNLVNLFSFWKADLILPLILVIVYLIFIIIVRGYAPTTEELINTFAQVYSKYGYEIIFLSALLESLVLVNFFVPGIVGMAMGAIFASTGQTQLTHVILTASMGASIGYSIDYLLGYFGFSDLLKKLGYSNFLSTAKEKLRSLGDRGLILGFIYPASGSLMSLTAGTTKMTFLKFLLVMVLSVFCWFSLWGILFYSFGEMMLRLITRYSFLILLLIIVLIILSRFFKVKKGG